MQSDPNLSKVTSIHNRVFYGYRSLKKVVLPQGLESIGDEVFSHCSLLKEIVLPNGLKEIGEKAFERSVLNSITIPSSVTYIEKDAFRDIETLTTVTFEGTTPPTGFDYSTFYLNYKDYDRNESFVIYVPIGSVEIYKKAISYKYGQRLEDKIRAKE